MLTPATSRSHETFSSLLQAHADNVFAVKLAYWLTR